MYAQRDKAGNIVGLYNRPQEGIAEEEVKDDAPEVLKFQERAAAAPKTPTDIICADPEQIKKLKAALGL